MKRREYVTPMAQVIMHTAMNILFSSGVHGELGAKETSITINYEDDNEE